MLQCERVIIIIPSDETTIRKSLLEIPATTLTQFGRKIRGFLFTVVADWDFTAVKLRRFLLYINNHWEYGNKQYTIEKPYKFATRNEKKFLIFQNLLAFRAFFEKAVVLENVQIWNQSIFLNETFSKASSLIFTEN